MRCISWIALAAVGLLAAGPLVAAPDGGSQPDVGELKFVLIVARHGIRPPLKADAALALAQAAQPWPQWEVPPEYLTPKGARLLTDLGRYYRALYVGEGLLTGDPAADARRVYLQSDNDERTIESAHSLARGLLPGANPAVVALPPGHTDPLFRPLLVPLGHPDMELARQAVLGRIGHDIPALIAAHRGAEQALARVLFGGDGTPPPGKTSPLDQAPEVRHSNRSDAVMTIEPFHRCMTLTENLMLEYEDGKPMADVGWGRVMPRMFTQLLELHSLYWDLANRTFYCAQVQGSNLAAHLLRTLEQAAAGAPRPGAFGTPRDRLVIITCHDTNQINLSGLLGVTWTIPGMQMNPVLPGGALVFELRQRAAGGPFLVRVQYVAQTLDQIRNEEPLSLAHPPFTAPIFIPGCSGSDQGSDADFGKFQGLMERVIDPQFTRW